MMMSALSSRSKTRIGASHHFFLVRINSHNSEIIDSLPIDLQLHTPHFHKNIFCYSCKESELSLIVARVEFVLLSLLPV